MTKFLSPLSWIKFLMRGVFVVLLVGGWVVALLATHIVVVPHEADDGSESWRVVVVPKSRLGVSDTYVDTRGWTTDEAAEHADLLVRMAEAGKGAKLQDLLEDAAVAAAMDRLREQFGR